MANLPYELTEKVVMNLTVGEFIRTAPGLDSNILNSVSRRSVKLWNIDYKNPYDFIYYGKKIKDYYKASEGLVNYFKIIKRLEEVYDIEDMHLNNPGRFRIKQSRFCGICNDMIREPKSTCKVCRTVQHTDCMSISGGVIGTEGPVCKDCRKSASRLKM